MTRLYVTDMIYESKGQEVKYFNTIINILQLPYLKFAVIKPKFWGVWGEVRKVWNGS